LTDYLNETSDFYNKCRQRAQNVGEPPLKFTDELSKKAERLESFSRHIEEEKQKVKGRFEEIKKYTLEMIDLKEKECIGLLEDEVSELSDLYMQWEELLVKEWPKSSDIEARYPTSDVLEQRMSRFVNLDQLQAFVKGVTEDIQSESQFGNEVDGLKRKVNSLISCARKVESSLPSLQGKLLESSSEDLQSLMKELLKGFDQQEIKIENSLVLKMKELGCCESQIINFQQYETLKNWLPNSNNFRLKLLYRGSEDGLSAEMFHKKCDGKGATITLIQSKFKGDASSRVLGGFADQSRTREVLIQAQREHSYFRWPQEFPQLSVVLREWTERFMDHRSMDLVLEVERYVIFRLKRISALETCVPTLIHFQVDSIITTRILLLLKMWKYSKYCREWMRVIVKFEDKTQKKQEKSFCCH